MAKSLPSTPRLQDFARVIALDKFQRSKHVKAVYRTRVVQPPEPAKPGGVRLEAEQLRVKMEESSKGGGRRQQEEEEQQQQRRVPLAAVVSDCVKRWFQDTLTEAKAGDSAMQVLVGQMYYSGYGVPQDAQKARAWISRASKSRFSALKVGDKPPGYNASDSDSDDIKDGAK